MKKRPESKSESLPCARLHREQLNEILDVLREAADRVTIHVANIEYESLDELQEHRGDEIGDQLCLCGQVNYGDDATVYYSPVIDVEIGWERLSLSLTGREDNDSFIAAYHKIRELLFAHRRVVLSRLNSGYVLVIAMIPLLLYTLFTSLSGGFGLINLLLLGVPAILLGHFGERAQMGWGTRAYLTVGYQTKSFWTRNRDQLIVNAVVAVASIILTAMVRAPVNRCVKSLRRRSSGSFSWTRERRRRSACPAKPP